MPVYAPHRIIHSADQTIPWMPEPIRMQDENRAPDTFQRFRMVQTLVNATIHKGTREVGIICRYRFDQRSQGRGEITDIHRSPRMRSLIATDQPRQNVDEPVGHPPLPTTFIHWKHLPAEIVCQIAPLEVPENLDEMLKSLTGA